MDKYCALTHRFSTVAGLVTTISAATTHSPKFELQNRRCTNFLEGEMREPKKQYCSTFLVLFASLTLGTTQLAAQDMSTYYTVMHPDEFDIDWTSFYRSMEDRTEFVRGEFAHHLDLAYGADPKQRLDLYLPEDSSSARPVFLFLHGGGFREGDRAQYGAVAEPFLNHRIITAVASYRLTVDGFHYPDQPEDVKSAIQWLYDNVSTYGGDPDSIYVGGHSAGAILAADIGADREWMDRAGIPRIALRGIFPVSGAYDVRERGRPGELYSYAPSPELLERASPVLHVVDPAPIAIVGVGSLEEQYQKSSQEFVAEMKAAGSDAYYLLLEGEDHKDTALSIANEGSELFQLMLRAIDP